MDNICWELLYSIFMVIRDSPNFNFLLIFVVDINLTMVEIIIIILKKAFAIFKINLIYLKYMVYEKVKNLL